MLYTVFFLVKDDLTGDSVNRGLRTKTYVSNVKISRYDRKRNELTG